MMVYHCHCSLLLLPLRFNSDVLFWPYVLELVSSETHRPASAQWWLVVWFMMWEEQIVAPANPRPHDLEAKPFLRSDKHGGGVGGVSKLFDRYHITVIWSGTRVSLLSVAIGSIFPVRAVKEVNFHGVSLVLFCRCVLCIYWNHENPLLRSATHIHTVCTEWTEGGMKRYA